jgi:Ca2+:H+ antiporter
LLVAVLLIASIVAVSVRIAHHAEVLAAKVGDPYGTMILALSAVLVEVVILLIKRVGEAVRLGRPMA